MNICPCASGSHFEDCCARLHQGQPAACAESLMRSRYSAYVLGNIDYLVATTLPAQQDALDRDAMQAWSLNSTWLGLDVESRELIGGQPEHAFVTFSAHWHDATGEHHQRECSAFVQNNGHWYFLDPTVPVKVGRNDPCLCGSSQKFKKCCSPYLG